MTRFTPFAEPDPLATWAGTERLRLADGVLMTADHFNTEQLYHRARLARLLAYLHGVGTVAGLDVKWSVPAGGAVELMVTPGLAVDYRGRLIELGYEACLPIADWVAAQAATGAGRALIAQGTRPAGGGMPGHMVCDLFADFAAYARRPEPAFATGNADKIDGVEPTLSQDAIYLHLVIRDAADDRLPESMISRLVPGAADAEAIRAAKRQALWPALAPRPRDLAPLDGQPPTEHDLIQQEFGGVFLARLRIPLSAGAGGTPAFDDTFDMTAPAAAPAFDGRLYSYSAAELALLAGQRR